MFITIYVAQRRRLSCSLLDRADRSAALIVGQRFSKMAPVIIR